MCKLHIIQIEQSDVKTITIFMTILICYQGLPMNCFKFYVRKF